MSTFSQRLKILRLEQNLSLRQLSALTGISPSALHSYEKDGRKPKREALEALADVFNVDVDYINGNSDIKNAVANALGFNSLAEIYAASPSEALSEGERALLELFRQLPEESQTMYLEVLRATLKSLSKD